MDSPKSNLKKKWNYPPPTTMNPQKTQDKFKSKLTNPHTREPANNKPTKTTPTKCSTQLPNPDHLPEINVPKSYLPADHIITGPNTAHNSPPRNVAVKKHVSNPTTTKVSNPRQSQSQIAQNYKNQIEKLMYVVSRTPQ
jgi:hypothetical protein